jgi:aminomethyltransferase
MSDTSARTPLYDEHVRRGARMMDFGGFAMPVQYSGIIEEHHAVRQAAGLFDVSHMGEIWATGPHATAFVQRLVTNDAAKLADGQAMYTAMCNERGGIVDDLLVYRMGDERWLLVVNASNIAKDWAHMQSHNSVGADLRNASDEWMLLALQGPKAHAIASKVAGFDTSEIPYYRFREVDGFAGYDGVILSHTGYTGEPGLEIYGPAESALDIWNALMEAGEGEGLLPAGLGARDTLRLEAGFSLYGNDLTDQTTPLEAGLGWVVKPDAGDFVGREALVQQKVEGIGRKLVGFVVEERGIPRHGDAIVDADGGVIGHVTSGSQSPNLSKGIGMGYVPNEPRFTEVGSEIGIAQRRKTLRATVAKRPFHK